MELTLVVQSGEASGKRFVVPSGNSLRVGRLAPAEVCVLDDPMLSGHHFAIECGEVGFLLRDLKSRFGTHVNGSPVSETSLHDGDTILAGRTQFVVEVIGESRPERPSVAEPTPFPRFRVESVSGDVSHSNHTAAVLAFLRRQHNLFALLDAARNPAILELLNATELARESLYDGEKGAEIAAFGPWFVELPPGNALLEKLVNDGWGDSWGVFLTCDASFEETRRHLRRFLLAKLPDGREVYFRYYDPRVLRTYVQTCTPPELGSFFGPIRNYFAPSADETKLLVFAPTFKDWQKLDLDAGKAPA